MIGYKVFTHDLCSPIQGGSPVWDGTLPHELPMVKLDESQEECSYGWNFTRDIKTGLLIAGLWPNGRPSRVFSVIPTGTIIEREDKIRSDKLTIVFEVKEEDINTAVYDFSVIFGDHRKHMTESQIAWRRALSRPHHDPAKIEECLAETLRARGLNWNLKRFDTVQNVWHVWNTWNAWDAPSAWNAWHIRDTWRVWDIWRTLDALGNWNAWNVWDTQTVRDTLTLVMIEFLILKKQVIIESDHLVESIRSAYENGLETVMPTGPNELGWSDKLGDGDGF